MQLSTNAEAMQIAAALTIFAAYPKAQNADVRVRVELGQFIIAGHPASNNPKKLLKWCPLLSRNLTGGHPFSFNFWRFEQ